MIEALPQLNTIRRELVVLYKTQHGRETQETQAKVGETHKLSKVWLILLGSIRYFGVCAPGIMDHVF